MSGGAGGKLAHNLVVPPTRRSGNKSDFETTPVRLMHRFDAAYMITIEDRNAPCQRLRPRTVPGSFGFARKLIGQDVEFWHFAERYTPS